MFNTRDDSGEMVLPGFRGTAEQQPAAVGPANHLRRRACSKLVPDRQNQTYSLRRAGHQPRTLFRRFWPSAPNQRRGTAGTGFLQFPLPDVRFEQPALRLSQSFDAWACPSRVFLQSSLGSDQGPLLESEDLRELRQQTSRRCAEERLRRDIPSDGSSRSSCLPTRDSNSIKCNLIS